MITPTVRRRKRQPAFTLVEVIVALAVVLVLAAVALPSLNGYLDRQAAEDAAEQLAIVRDALTGSGGFYAGVAKNASRLSALSAVIVKTNAGYLDSCGAQFATKDVTAWEGTGPYVNFVIDRTTGMSTAIGTARDTITRLPFSATAGNLRINFIDGVETRNAELLDDIVDGTSGVAGNNTAGTVQWTLPAVNGLVTMYYLVPVNNKC